MKTFVLLRAIAPWFTIALSTGASAAGESAPDDIMGRWATEGFGSIVELYPCRHQADLLCGRITWLWDATDKQGRPHTDRHNPESKNQSRPLVGVEVLRNAKETAPDQWTGGELYNPDDGRTYSGSIRAMEDGRLELEGCAVFGIFCDSQTWYRPEALIARPLQESK